MKKKCLIIETHSDDSCYSAGGFIRKYQSNYEFYSLMIACSSTFLYHKSKKVDIDTRMKEYEDYCRYLNIDCLNHRALLSAIDADTKLDTVPLVTIVGMIERAISIVKPDLLIMQGNSVHQDHTATYKACLAALRPCCGFYPAEIWIMENPTHVHLDPTFRTLEPNVYVELSEEEINGKVALFESCFPSQIRTGDNYLGTNSIKDWARYRGIESRCAYAEAFYQFSRRI